MKRFMGGPNSPHFIEDMGLGIKQLTQTFRYMDNGI